MRAVQSGDLDQITSLVLNDGADLECRDKYDRTLKVIAAQSELMLPQQKDAVRDLLTDLPGRLAVQFEGGQFSGNKLNANAIRHKFERGDQRIKN